MRNTFDRPQEGIRMAKPPRMHSGDEFGKPASGALSGMDAPMIGAPSLIAVDALAEHEPGARPVTERPPAITLRMVAIALAAMFVLGLGAYALTMFTQDRVGPGDLALSYSSAGTGRVAGNIGLRVVSSAPGDRPSAGVLSVEVTQSVSGDGEAHFIAANIRFDPSTVFLVDGRPLDTSPKAHGLSLRDVTGWHGIVQYVRATGSDLPRAIRVSLTSSP